MSGLDEELNPFEKIVIQASRHARWVEQTPGRVAEMARMSAEGHVFDRGCQRDEQSNEDPDPKWVKAIVAGVVAAHKAACAEGRHSVGCGHPPSHVPMHKWNRLGD